jgi:hypothetical protein
MAPFTLTVRDETTSGKALATLDLQLEAEQVTVAELIRARVHQEVRAHNADRAAAPRFNGLVQPERTERELNARGGGTVKPVDAEKQTEVALHAFGRGQILLLVDDRQVEELDQQVTLRPDSTVTFLKLVPLVGG